jgi:hypothetical protein
MKSASAAISADALKTAETQAVLKISTRFHRQGISLGSPTTSGNSPQAEKAEAVIHQSLAVKLCLKLQLRSSRLLAVVD